MQPVLHSSCSAPVPYVSGMTALEIDTCVRAGFPSPAEDFQAERIDVLKYIVLHPQATYTLRVRGDSMRDEGIFDGDVILVDRAIKPRHGHIVVAVVDGAFTCKKLWLRGGKVKLRNVLADKVIDLVGMRVENGTQAQIWQDVFGENQLWSIQPVPDKLLQKDMPKPEPKKTAPKSTRTQTGTGRAKKTGGKGGRRAAK